MKPYEAALLAILFALSAVFLTLKSLPPPGRCPAKAACCGCRK